MADPNQIYGTFGGTPEQKPSGSSGAGSMSARASGGDFGAQVGKARQVEGAVHQELGKMSMDFAQKYTGMMNDTLANQKAEEYMIAIGKMQEDLKSKSGNAAAAYMPEYIKGLTKLRADMRTGMPMQAALSFDGLTRVPEGYAITTGHSYVAGQIRAGVEKTARQGVSAWVAQAMNGDYANNDGAMGFVEGNIEANVNKLFMDEPGTQFNPEVGRVEFLNTPEGKLAFEEMSNELDKHVGDANLNRFSTLTEQHGVRKAYGVYQEAKERIPKPTQALLESYFIPKLREADINNTTGSIMEDARRSYYASVASPEAVRSTNVKLNLANAIFGVETSFGANIATSHAGARGPMQIMPDTWETWKNLGIVKPGEDINNPADNRKAGYRALGYYLDQYGDPERAAVAYFSGPGNASAPGSPTPWVNDVTDAKDGVPGKYVSEYVAEAMNIMGGRTPAPEGVTIRPLTAVPSEADLLINHYEDYQRMAAERAEQVRPGDVDFAKAVYDDIERNLNNVIKTQKTVKDASEKRVLLGIAGGLTDGRAPTTKEQLLAISPQIRLDYERARTEDPALFEKVNAQLTENSRQQSDKNSMNYYRIMRRAITDDKFGEEALHKLFTRTDGTGINRRDYIDLMRVVDDKATNSTWLSDFVAPALDEITAAGGNADGNGESRAIQYMNMLERARREKEKSGVGLDEMMDDKNFKKMKEAFMPSKEKQIEHMSKNTMIPAVLNLGDIVMGYEYIGGDPATTASWRRAQ